jgi:hypothetical protein
MPKNSEILPPKGEWRVYYLEFARQGWTKAARQYANKIASGKQKGAIGELQGYNFSIWIRWMKTWQ